jgi:diguanylate cyclase (GGDEF)-like protein
MDVATVMSAAVVVGWYMVVPDDPGALLHAAAPVLMGPVILLLCIFVVAKLTMSGTAPFTRWCGLTGTVASAVKSGADTMSAGGLTPSDLHWFLAATVTTHALLTIAVRLNHVQVAVDPGMLTVRRRRSFSLLPYGAIGVTYLLLTVAVMRDDHTSTRIALGGAIVSTVLVVARQIAAFRDNERLLRELDTKVNELHLAQEGLRGSLAERDTLADRLSHLAFHDGLTGLPNRSLFLERLDGALLSSTPAGGEVVVMLIDLDDFKLVNDAWGHGAGDTLLREVAGRLTGCVRAHDTVARLGGDEFAVLIEPLPGDDPAEIAARIVRAVQQPVAVETGFARVGASVGIAVHDGSSIGAGTDAESLLREADHAMYAVKRDGKGSFAVAVTPHSG